MTPIDYQTHCAACHSLQFDARFAEPAPHDKPGVVIEYVRAKFTQYIAKHPEEIHQADPADPRILRPPRPPARDADEWIARRVADAEELLWRKSCKECHTLTFGSGLPGLVPSAIPIRWMNNAVFRHDAHQMLACAECHASAAKSSETSDVLLPGIATCRECHHSGPESAEAQCFECHVYHDWSKEKRIDGKQTISGAIHQ